MNPAPLELGARLLQQGEPLKAQAAFLEALHATPHAAEPRIGLAQASERLGDALAATAWLSDACRVSPDRVELWLDLARLLSAGQRDAELEPMLRLALAVHPMQPLLLQAQGDLYLRRRQFGEALQAYERLLVLAPGHAAALLHYGFCHEQLGDAGKAAAFYRRAIEARPDLVEAWVDLAGVLWRVEDFEGSLAAARRAVDLAPGMAHAVRILGTALLNANRVEEARLALRRALDLQPGLLIAELDMAFCLLLQGELAEGFRLYAQRWRDTERMRRPSFFRPELEWQGPLAQPPAGRRIAVYAEQGLGDVIQFVRYVQWLQDAGAQVLAVLQPELVPLVERSFPGLQCLRAGGPPLEADHHVALLDLPLHAGTTLESLPARLPYLHAEPAAVDRWAARLPAAQGRLRVGLAWSGSAAQVNNGNRAMRLSELAPLFTDTRLQCFSLQMADAGPLTDVLPAPGQLLDFTALWTDFGESAAMLMELDLVVTVDTSIAHLAGALGKPVWLMLPPNADWRWLLQREDSPWYPGVMRLFRRGFGEPRAAQVARVRQALEALLAARA